MIPVWDRKSVPPLATALVAKVEAFRAHAYDDGSGNLTIGYGSLTMPGGARVRASDTLSLAAATALLATQLATWAAAVAAHVPAVLTTNGTAALISFVHNLGAGVLSTSTLVAMLRAGDHRAFAQLPGWALNKGQIDLGLLRRRELEWRIALGADLTAYASVWQLNQAQLMPAYRQAFADAAAFHAGSKVTPGPNGTLTFAHPAAADDAETDALNAAQVAAHSG